MRTNILAGLTAVVAATAIAAPAQAQIISAPAPQISAGACKVRYSRDTGTPFTYAQCAINVNNVPYGKTVKVHYKSNLKTFNPHSEIGPFKGDSGTISFPNPGGLPGQKAGDASDMTGAVQLAFPGKRVNSISKHLKVTLSSATPGAVVADATATAATATATAAQVPEIPPAQPAVPIVPPAQPASPTAGATLKFGDCKIARSSHGYSYAVCSVRFDNVPYGQTVSTGYRSDLKPFTPRTNVKWGKQNGTISVTNNMDGEAPGPANMTGSVKLAFKGLTEAQLRKQLNVGSTGSDTAAVLQPIANNVY